MSAPGGKSGGAVNLVTSEMWHTSSHHQSRYRSATVIEAFSRPLTRRFRWDDLTADLPFDTKGGEHARTEQCPERGHRLDACPQGPLPDTWAGLVQVPRGVLQRETVPTCNPSRIPREQEYAPHRKDREKARLTASGPARGLVDQNRAPAL